MSESESKHTPGPWEVRYSTNVFARGRSIASTGGFNTNEPEREEIEHRANLANAQLIAAAPDMLAALERCLSYFVGIALSPFEQSLVSEVQAALSKVRGNADE